MNYLLTILLFLSTLNAKTLHPTFILNTTDLINDFIIDKNYLYAVTDGGSVDIFDLSTHKMIKQIVLEPLHVSNTETLKAKIYKIDKYADTLVFISNSKSMYRNVWLYKNNTLTQLINASKKLFIKEAHFINENQILFSTFSSEVILYEREEHYKMYERQVAFSTLGAVAISEDKKNLVLADESGEIEILKTKDSSSIKSLKALHVDNIYSLDYKNGVVISGGKDRRVGVYQKNSNPYYLKSNFLVYAVGLSPSGLTGAYSSGFDNDIQLFEIKSKRKKELLVGHKSVINKIIFVSENQLFSSAYENKILFWNLNN